MRWTEWIGVDVKLHAPILEANRTNFGWDTRRPDSVCIRP
jgi:hypothetical protein